LNYSIHRLAQASLLIATIVTSSVALAGDHERDGKKGRRGPPPQAFEACQDLQEGAACEVQTRRGNLLSGECRVPRERLRQRIADGQLEALADNATITQDSLVCAPDRRKRREQTQLR